MRKAAVGGAIAWTAPALMSLATPAAAASPGNLVVGDASSIRTEGNTLSVAQPAGTAVGDLLVAAIHIESGTGEIGSLNASWNVIGSVNQSSNLGMRLYWRIATATSATYTWGTSGKKTSGGIIAISGANATTPIDASGASSGSNGTMTAPAVTTSVAGTVLLAFFGSKKGSASHNAPTGMTPKYLTANADFRSSGNTQALTSSGGTGSRASGSSDGDSWVGFTVAVKA